jgi:hypothetical protein
MKNTGIPYEVFTKAIFQQLLKQDKVETIRLEHDITFKGKTTSHQIDIYWEFKAGGVVYYTCVQAKDWVKPVPQGHVFTFKSVLEDLKFRATGIMVCRSGYQQGAKDFADGNGILLYELREMEERDWDGRIQKIIVNIVAQTPSVQQVKFIVDQDWLDAELQRVGVPKGDSVAIDGYIGDIDLTDESESQVGTVASVVESLIPSPLVDMDAIEFSHTFTEPTFASTGHQKLPRIKLHGVSAVVSVQSLEQKMVINGDDIVRFILSNVMDGSSRVFREDEIESSEDNGNKA